MKRVLAIFLSIMILISVVTASSLTTMATDEPVTNVTTDGYEYIILADNTVEITGYSGDKTDLEIPSEINGYTVTSIGDYAFSMCGNIVNITIPDTVTNIGEGAFFRCTKIQTITIPNSVTSINSETFYGCINLVSVDMGDSVTSIGCSAFEECMKLSSITINALTSSIDTTAFKMCANIESINVHPDNKIYDSRDNCNAIIETASNTLIKGCNNSFIPDTVTQIGDMAFFRCIHLAEISIPNTVTKIGEWAFADCYALTKITIPDSVISIGSCAFETCTNLESITMSNSVRYAGSSIFYDTKWYNEYPDGLMYLNNVLWGVKGDKSELNNITIKDGIVCVADSAFELCISLTDVTIPESVRYIGNKSFYCCNKLTSITIPTSVIYIGEMALGYYIKYGYGVQKTSDFTVYGYSDSFAYDYASNNSFQFIDLETILKPDTLVGDIDGDGNITVLDATKLQQHLANKNLLPDEALSRADTDKDGSLAVMDATLIQRFVAKIITAF